MNTRSVANSEEQTKKNMDNMYRWTRHVYDLTRKYYLLGRDVLVERLDAQDDDIVCEVGCGTARNLIKVYNRYPRTTICGLDASDEMLKTAQGNLNKENIPDAITLRQGFSQSFDPQKLFGLDDVPNKYIFSYALSIIPPWQESIDHALKLLPVGGEMHIVDFGGQEELPKWFKNFLFWWLKMFHVYHKPEILDYLKRLEVEKKGTLKYESLYKGYAYRAVFTKAG